MDNAIPAALLRSSQDPLFVDVARQGLFADGKTFIDAVPRAGDSLARIRSLYAAERERPGFSLADFVAAHFTLPGEPASDATAFHTDDSRSLREHIDALWPYLTRQDPAPDPAVDAEGSTLLPLPGPYVVPGGRFREIYYWDSYFTLLGLLESGQRELAESMVRNFAFLIGRHGHMPNGNRRYYLSRSHPPYFFKMVEAVAPAHDPAEGLVRYLPQLKQEHAYWMSGSAALRPGEASAHVVCLPDGSLLNRHWDAFDAPRDEMYAQDVHTAGTTQRPPAELWRDLRAACESGWDFSSRWAPFREGGDAGLLGQLETTSIIPIDLNCLLHGLECAISRACERSGDPAGAAAFAVQAQRRQAAIDRYLWSPTLGHYVDHHWVRNAPCNLLTAGTLYPLFMGLANAEQAAQVADQVRQHLLKEHGLATTTVASGEQWDLPNGWAPLHWVAVDGLNRYQHTGLARDIATRWLNTVNHVYRKTGKLLEKYDITSLEGGSGGGEYPMQDGFGWTNGVTRKLLAMYGDEAIGE